MTLSYREKILLILLGFFILLFCGLRFAVLPAQNQYTDAQIRLKNAFAEQISASTAVQKAPQIEKQLSDRMTAADKIAATFFPTLDGDILNKWADGIASKSGVGLSGVSVAAAGVTAVQEQMPVSGALNYPIRDYADILSGASSAAAPGAAAGTTKVMSAQLSLTMSGSYQNACAFIDNLKNSGRAVSITSYNFSKNNNVFSIAMTLTCYGVKKPDENDSVVSWSQIPVSNRNLM